MLSSVFKFKVDDLHLTTHSNCNVKPNTAHDFGQKIVYEMRDSNVQLHHERILGYPCVNLCMQSSIRVTTFIFLLRKF